MRIIMLVHSLRRGGAERVALELAVGLRATGHRVEIVAWLDIDEYDDERYSEIPRKYLLPSRDYRWIKSIPKSARDLREYVLEVRPDVIQIHSPNLVWLAAWANLKIRIVHVLHGYGTITRSGGVISFVVRQIHRWVNRRTNAKIVTVSEKMREPAAKFFGVEKAQVDSVVNGVAHESFKFLTNKPKRNPTILMLGTLSAHKGQHLGIQAFKDLARQLPEARMIIVGDGESRTVLEDAINNLSLNESISLTGRRNDLGNVFESSDLLWQLSKSEAMPMVVIEAMAAGVPVIGFDVEGVNEVVVDAETGHLVRYGDLDAIVEKSLNTLTNTDSYNKLRALARLRFENAYSYETFVRLHEKWLAPRRGAVE
jgi:glycosyltransferase involved in cell wall biosynthesis